MASRIDRCSGLVCDPAALEPDQRAAHFALITRLFGRLAQEHEELPDGYVYRFAGDALDLVLRFIANERRCCPFLDFELVVAANRGPVRLRISGPPGTREVLRAELAVSD